MIAIHKGDGKDFRAYLRVWHVLKKMRPEIVHTRNLSALEANWVAAVAGIRARIHGEHGRDVYDPDGLSFKYNFLRKSVKPFVHRYIAVSTDLSDWLIHTVGVRADRVRRICNGVDTKLFSPRSEPRSNFGPNGFASSEHIVVGTVGRMEAIKDPLTFVRAFVKIMVTDAAARERLRLVLVGDGTLREAASRLVEEAGIKRFVWLAGERGDIPQFMRNLDLFVLPSLREGISNTILEAMASGLPVIATNVGGNSELVENGKTGILIPPSEPHILAKTIMSYVRDPGNLIEHGRAGRQRAENEFSMESMVNRYLAVYDEVLSAGREGISRGIPPDL